MARFHVNRKGEAGKCRAFTGNCPFGGDADHYRSPEEARAAFEKKMGGSFTAPPEVSKISRRDLTTVASTSKDPDELMAVALSGNKKAIIALGKNPAATPDALAEARTKADRQWDWSVDLEDHPNYPVWGMTGVGIHKKAKRGDFQGKDPKDTIFASNEAGDKVLIASSFLNDAGAFQLNNNFVTKYELATITNTENQVSDDEVTRRICYARDHEKRVLIPAAARAGRFPDSRGLAGKVGNYGPGDSRLPPDLVVASIKHQGSVEKLEASAKYLKKHNFFEEAKRGFLENPRTPKHIIDEIAESEQSLSELLSRRQAEANG